VTFDPGSDYIRSLHSNERSSRATPGFDEELCRRLEVTRDQGLDRHLRRVESPQGTRLQIDRETLLNFSSNDYLGLADHPALKEAAIRTVEKFGAGSGASRLISGSLAPHHELEEALADFKGTAAALTFTSGYATAIGTIGALLGKDDVIIIDRLVHACIVDAARLCGAKLRVFSHNDVNDLEDLLEWAQTRSATTNHPSRTLVVTGSVFSMDGDLAPRRDIVDLKEKYGAWLMVDEAHATGLFGRNRRGLTEECGLSERVEVQMGTLGKALGAAGGYVCGTRTLIECLTNSARSFIFSTAPVPAAAAAAQAAIELVRSPEGEQRRVRLWERVDQLKNGLIEAGWALTPVRSAIIPLVLGDEANVVEAANELRSQGIYLPAIRYPTVARGAARLRITVSADHAAGDIPMLVSALQTIGRRTAAVNPV